VVIIRYDGENIVVEWSIWYTRGEAIVWLGGVPKISKDNYNDQIFTIYVPFYDKSLYTHKQSSPFLISSTFATAMH